jgi:hypothetical protein
MRDFLQKPPLDPDVTDVVLDRVRRVLDNLSLASQVDHRAHLRVPLLRGDMLELFEQFSCCGAAGYPLEKRHIC